MKRNKSALLVGGIVLVVIISWSSSPQSKNSLISEKIDVPIKIDSLAENI
jgi:hypothetical protein